ncbi:SulP family inorganic anion transporter, partial [Armatimonas sp.]|uniref:SulP family inorganic anion transporter n=1 Tax=Armatimonas sp. TaxID=1872638 RepID=UPI00286A5C73
MLSGFLVFLIALPLCLGIASASGAPPISGILTAIIGGIVAPFLGSARFIIKGPAAGMIVIVLAAITDLGQGDLSVGYPRMLAVGVVAGGLQIVLALFRVGNLGRLMPTSVVQGMLTAIGVIILSKQVHVLLGVKPLGKEPLALLREVPQSIASREGSVFLVGLVALGILIGMPLISKKLVVLRAIPLPLVILLATI